MPTYDIRNKYTGEEKEVFCSYSKLQEYVSGDWIQIHKDINQNSIVTEVGGTLRKTSGDWKDLLKRIDKGAGRRSNMKL